MTATVSQARSTAAAGRLLAKIGRARFFEHITRVRVEERRSVVLFSGYAFLLLVSYYILRTLREPLLLVDAPATMKTYASAAAAAVLLFFVPLYGYLFRRVTRDVLGCVLTGFFIATFFLLYAAARAGFDIGLAYYVWVGVFGVTIVAQFWAYAADSFDVARGERLFPVIMAGATLGALAGPCVFCVLHATAGPWWTLLAGLAILAATLPLIGSSRAAARRAMRGAAMPGAAAASAPSTAVSPERADGVVAPEGMLHRAFGGFALVFNDRRLFLIAALVVLLNCVNTLGEYLLGELVVRHAGERMASDPSFDKAVFIGAFYSNYAIAVNALTVLAQLFLVARLFRWIGVHGALVLLPAVALIGYGLVAFVPVLALVRLVKIIQSAGDYSVMNTARQALFLPLPAARKYEGKIAADAFFWRFGDLVPAAIVYLGTTRLDFGPPELAAVNAGLCVVWLAVAVRLGAEGERVALMARARACLQRASVLVHVPAPRRLAVGGATWLALALGLGVLLASSSADAAPANAAVPRGALFDSHAPLALELVFDPKALCREPQRTACAPTAATLLYRDDTGAPQQLAVQVRVRGRYRRQSGGCALPALFVHFGDGAQGSPFEGEPMLPLTTHCERRAPYEQYVLKEYLAYRLYNALTDESLRVRLVRMTYRDEAGRTEPYERYAFFTEHFDALARRHGARVVDADSADLARTDPTELALFDLFQYAIGNTDWSAFRGHNVVLLEAPSGRVSAVPFDFDFAGIVNAEYAGPPPELPIRNVRQRLFRGVCRPQIDWDVVFARFAAQRAPMLDLLADLDGLAETQRADVRRYLEEAFQVIESPARRAKAIVESCRGSFPERRP